MNAHDLTLHYKAQMNTLFGNELLQQYVLFTFIIIFLVLGVVIFRTLYRNRRLKNIQPTITYESLDKMRKTGLISEEEYQHTRETIRKHILASIEEEKSGAAAAKDPLTPKHPREIAQEIEKETLLKNEKSKIPDDANSRIEQVLKEFHPEPRKKETPVKEKQRPIDVEDLYRRGVISEEEYKQLRSFFDQNSS